MILKIDKEKAIKHLWDANDDITKAIKGLSTNPLCGSLDGMWGHLDSYRESLKHLLKYDLTPGKFYKSSYYKEEEILFRFNHYCIEDSGVKIQVSIISSKKKDFHYHHLVSDMSIGIGNLIPNGTYEEIQIDPKDLPLYVSWEFHGELYKELMSQAGLPFTPEPAEEE